MKEFIKYIAEFNIRALFLSRTENPIIQMFRYVFVGGIAFLADSSALFLLASFGMHYLISAIFAFGIGLTVNFALTKRFIFVKSSNVVGKYGEFIAYSIIGVIGLLFTELILYALTDIFGVYFMISKIIAAAIVLIWNFAARKIALYSKKR